MTRMTLEMTRSPSPRFLAELVRQGRQEHPDWSEAFCFGLAVPLGFYYHSNDHRSPSRWIAGTRLDMAASLKRHTDAAPDLDCATLVRTALRENALAMDLDRTHWEAIMGMELLAEDFEAWAARPDAAACARAAAEAIDAPPGGALWRGLYTRFARECAAWFAPAAEMAGMLDSVCDDWRALSATLRGESPPGERFPAAGRQIRRLAMREEYFWGRVLDATEH